MRKKVSRKRNRRIFAAGCRTRAINTKVKPKGGERL